jgi:hypothetical protein
MAITIDTANIASFSSGSSVSSYSFSVTIASGDNCLVVTEGNASGGGGLQPSGITYGGIPLTMVPSSSIIAAQFQSSIWYLLNPTVGTANVVVTLPSAQSFQGSGAIPLIGVSTTTPIGTAAINSGVTVGGNVTVTASGGIAGDLYVGNNINFDTSQTTSGSNQTNQWSQNNIGTAVCAAGDTIPGVNTGAFAWTATGTIGGSNGAWTGSAVVFKAIGSGANSASIAWVRA